MLGSTTGQPVVGSHINPELTVNVWQALAMTLAATIYRTSYAPQADHLRRFLCEIDHCSPADQMFMGHAVRQLYASRGQIRMEQLANQACLSSRQFERRFKGLIGFTAKTMARLIRFETMRHHLLTQPATSLTDLAYAAGYHDQAHCIHDFKALAGCSPQQFVKQAQARSMTDFYNSPRPQPAIFICEFPPSLLNL